MTETYTISAFSAANLTGSCGGQAIDPGDTKGNFQGYGPYSQGSEAGQPLRIRDDDPADGEAGRGYRADTFDDGVTARQFLDAPATFTYREDGQLKTVTFPEGTRVQSEFTQTMASGHDIMGLRLVHPETGQWVTAGYFVDPPEGQPNPPPPGTNFGEVESTDDWGDSSYASRAGPPCFCPGTRIATPDGLRAVETLRVGDLVRTQGGVAPLVWVGRVTVPAADWTRRPSLWPIRLGSGGADGRGGLSVSPQHRVLVEGAGVELAHGVPQVLIPARAFLVAGVAKVARTAPAGQLVYHHLALDGHGLLEAEGLAVESLWRADVMMPDAPVVGGPSIRPVLTVRAGAALLAAGRVPGGVRVARLPDGAALDVA